MSEILVQPSDEWLSELEFRISVFGDRLERLRGIPIALYGSGLAAQGVVERYGKQFDIVHVVDDKHAGDVICGRAVVDLATALGGGIRAVVVCARMSVVEVILNRIGGQCLAHGVQVFDMYGNDLPRLFETLSAADGSESSSCLAVGYDVVSFDMFCVSGACANTYRRLYCSLAARGVVTLLTCNDDRSVRELMRIVDVMGLPAPDYLAAGGDCSPGYSTGMFRLLHDRFPGKKILHIGHDRIFDGYAPRTAGVDSLLVGEKVALPLRQCAKGNASIATTAIFEACAKTSADHALLEILSRDIEKRTACSGQVADRVDSFARLVIAPILIGQTLLLARRLCESDLDGVIFVSRDGFLPMKLYDRLRASELGKGLPASTYLRCSRRAAALALADDQEVCRWLMLKGCEFTNSDMLFRLFGIPRDELAAVEEDWLPTQAAGQFQDQICSIAQKELIGLRNQARKAGIVEDGRYAFVDFYSAGTTQALLSKALHVRLDGVYGAIRKPSELLWKTHACGFMGDGDAAFFERGLFIETFVSSGEPSVISYEVDGSPVFEDDPRPESDLLHLQSARSAVLGLFEELLPRLTAGDELSHELADALILLGDDDIPMLAYDSLKAERIRPEYCGRPAKAVMRTVQSVLYGLLAEFDRVCRENDLSYVALHGTLLGAVRDGGIVEGDDDLDVGMPRVDYDRLVCLAADGAFRAPYFLQTPRNESACFYGGYSRLRDSSTSAIEPGSVHRNFNQGMWMDVIPLDNCPTSDAAVERRQRIVRTWQRALYAQTYGLDLSKLWDADPRKLSLYFVLADHLSRDALLTRLDGSCKAVRRTGLLTTFAANFRCVRNEVRLRVEDVRGAMRVPFGDSTVPVPLGAEEWLARRYGTDWRQAAGKTGHEVLIDPNIPYMERLGEDGDDE